ncbi:MAG: type II secretion system F family protein, partial [Alphaproteobacteria bacterium]|nr:type II secretion system F family protein [Alphaproteobacteria bacterium]
MGAQSTSLLIFTKQFAAMVRSRLPLVSVLDNLSDETPQKNLKVVIEDVAESVKGGIDLGDALEEHPDFFSPIFINVIRAGMLSGKLAGSLTQMAEYLENLDELQRKIRGALSYPAFMFVAFFLVFNGMIFGILPRFQVMYANLHKALPAPTQILLDVGAFWAANWYLVIGGTVILIVTFAAWIKTEDGRLVWDR